MGLIFRDGVGVPQVSKVKEIRKLTSLNAKFLRSLGFKVTAQNVVR